MRNGWLALALILCAGALPAGGQETAVSALAPLPEGDAGLAAKYPGDVGIEKDPAVVLCDNFEDYTKAADVHRKWNFVLHDENMRIAEDSANVHHGRKAVEFALPQQREGNSAALYNRITETRDVLFFRFYSKFEKDYNQRGSCHTGCVISANYFPGGNATPGIRADGKNKFLANLETERPDPQPPGALVVYCYHPEQRSRYGDHIFPTGKVSPSPELPSPFGPQFVARPDIIPERDRWYCYEFMLKANTPGQRDGRIACWLDGKVIADFPNFRFRDVDSLKIDIFGVQLYLNPNLLRANKKWYDDLVAATSYIGPMVDATKTPAKP